MMVEEQVKETAVEVDEVEDSKFDEEEEELALIDKEISSEEDTEKENKDENKTDQPTE